MKVSILLAALETNRPQREFRGLLQPSNYPPTFPALWLCEGTTKIKPGVTVEIDNTKPETSQPLKP